MLFYGWMQVCNRQKFAKNFSKYRDEPESWRSESDEMENELKQIFGRQVDLVSRRGIESSRNYIRRNAILNAAEIIYATG